MCIYIYIFMYISCIYIYIHTSLSLYEAKVPRTCRRICMWPCRAPSYITCDVMSPYAASSCAVARSCYSSRRARRATEGSTSREAPRKHLRFAACRPPSRNRLISFAFLAPPAGLEPATHGLGNRTAEIANRDQHGNQPKQTLKRAVSGSDSQDFNRQNPADSRDFPRRSARSGEQSLLEPPHWRRGRDSNPR